MLSNKLILNIKLTLKIVIFKKLHDLVSKNLK